MRFASKIGLSLSLVQAILSFWAALVINGGLMKDIFFASIYLPLIPLRSIGLPVTDGYSGWGWAGPSPLGYVLVILFWVGVWFLAGYGIESILKK